VIANNTASPCGAIARWSIRSSFWASSFIVWAHHLAFMTGMGTSISAFFQVTTMIISIPSVVILTALLLSLWGRRSASDADAVRARVRRCSVSAA
jgi:cytochrome c oxidase subunit 1